MPYDLRTPDVPAISSSAQGDLQSLRNGYPPRGDVLMSTGLTMDVFRRTFSRAGFTAYGEGDASSPVPPSRNARLIGIRIGLPAFSYGFLVRPSLPGIGHVASSVRRRPVGHLA
jgi:hypothetical protein